MAAILNPFTVVSVINTLHFQQLYYGAALPTAIITRFSYYANSLCATIVCASVCSVAVTDMD